MKPKILILSLISLLIFSCKSDDESAPSTPPIPVDQRYLSEIMNEQGETTVTMEYNADKTLKKMSAGGFVLRFEYNSAGKVTTMHIAMASEGSATFHYTYDENGKINSYENYDGEVRPVQYNAQEDSYQFEDEYSTHVVFLNDNQSFQKIIHQEEGEEETTLNIFYENGKYGAFHNTNEIALPVFLAAADYYYFIFLVNNLTKEPIEEAFGGAFYISHENEYDQDNFLTTSIVNAPTLEINSRKLTYKYIQL